MFNSFRNSICSFEADTFRAIERTVAGLVQTMRTTQHRNAIMKVALLRALFSQRGNLFHFQGWEHIYYEPCPLRIKKAGGQPAILYRKHYTANN